MLDKASKILQIIPALFLITLGVIAVTKSTDLSLLDREVEELSQQTIYLNVKDQNGDEISEYTVSIHPKYSFHNIHPKYEVSRLEGGDLRLLVSFSSDFVLRVNAQGYAEYRKELDIDSSRNLSVMLTSQKGEQGSAHQSTTRSESKSE